MTAQHMVFLQCVKCGGYAIGEALIGDLAAARAYISPETRDESARRRGWKDGMCNSCQQTLKLNQTFVSIADGIDA